MHRGCSFAERLAFVQKCQIDGVKIRQKDNRQNRANCDIILKIEVLTEECKRSAFEADAVVRVRSYNWFDLERERKKDEYENEKAYCTAFGLPFRGLPLVAHLLWR